MSLNDFIASRSWVPETMCLLGIFQQFTFVIRQKEQYTNLRISNNTNRCDRQK